MVDDSSEPDKHFLRKIAYYTFEQLQCDNVSCSIACFSDGVMKAYNEKYRNYDYVPDVLSFPAGDMPNTIMPYQEHTSYIGDVLICIAQIKKQALVYKQPFLHELARVVIHGILHLLGYTHQSYRIQDTMIRTQEHILSNFLSVIGK